jgi:glycosyltransferase involved in cell wall biosynthesis
LFVLPTYTECFGIVVAEALACGTPVITTKGAPWSELLIRNAGWWIEIGVEPLVSALNEALRLTHAERRVMGANGRQLIEENYSIVNVGKKMIHLYKWLLHEAERPDFVQLLG